MTEPALEMTPEEIRVEGFKILCREMGPAAALRFALQCERGRGDYSNERHELTDDLTLEQVQALVLEAAGKPAKSPKLGHRSRHPRK